MQLLGNGDFEGTADRGRAAVHFGLTEEAFGHGTKALRLLINEYFRDWRRDEVSPYREESAEWEMSNASTQARHRLRLASPEGADHLQSSLLLLYWLLTSRSSRRTLQKQPIVTHGADEIPRGADRRKGLSHVDSTFWP